eukprot:m.29898 g.29898  ORF g.29898 m.29898 type:complete len:397 (+) comp4642_c0_seq2:80-1270(+)
MPSQHNLGIAFAMTAGAGLATSIGAATVFLPRFDDKKYLGISLAFAAGVMLYVSFVEIFIKSYDAFSDYFDEKNGVDTSIIAVDDYEPSNDAYYCTTATFFGGILITWFLDHMIHLINDHTQDEEGTADKDTKIAMTPLDSALLEAGQPAATSSQGQGEADHARSPAQDDHHHHHHHDDHHLHVQGHNIMSGSAENLARILDERSTSYVSAITTSRTDVSAITSRTAVESAIEERNEAMERRLLRMALVTGLAITLHNFPEGLATFVAAAEEPANGAPIAIAIGVHNIPEGICVAAPIYHATKSRWRAFFWGTVSGLAETLAGAIGWIVFSHRDGDMGFLAYAILFGLVSGMMTFISFKELIVTALEYDEDRRYFMPMLAAGMLVMAVSLMVFQVA